MAKLTLLAISSKVNPERMLVKVTPAANYVQGTADLFDMTQIADPSNIGLIPMNAVPILTPSPYNENLGGNYTAIVRGTTLSNYGIRYYAAGGTEVATGAMPAAILAGELTLDILVPTDQQS
jgi:hypothetical protein